MSGAFYDYNLELLITLASAVELLHTATLLHDDTVDNSDLRRGRPTVNSLWGNTPAVLLGDYLFSKSAGMVASLDNKRLIDLFAQTLMTISTAELEQTLDAFHLKKTRDRYFRWISGKTAAIFAMATESGAILSGAPEEAIIALRNYGLSLGLAFQIVDDILDFTGEEKEMGKPVGSDLMQGALTLPVILLMEREPGDNLVRSFFESRDPLYLKTVLDRITDSAIPQECYKIASTHCDTARATLRELPDKPMRHALDELAEFVVERTK
jgi:geranylgeranyl pyrophosphate synthase